MKKLTRDQINNVRNMDVIGIKFTGNERLMPVFNECGECYGITPFNENLNDSHAWRREDKKAYCLRAFEHQQAKVYEFSNFLELCKWLTKTKG